MAQKITDVPRQVVERNLTLINQLMQFIFERPRILESLPNQFQLVVLPDDDPEIRDYNLFLLDKYIKEAGSIVFARLTSTQEQSTNQMLPSFYAPVAIA